MVLLGGLEVLAAGYIVHQHQKHKKLKEQEEIEEEEARQRRRRRRHERKHASHRASSAPPAADFYYSSKPSKESLPPSRPSHVTSHSSPSYWASSESLPPKHYNIPPSPVPALKPMQHQYSGQLSPYVPQVYAPEAGASQHHAYPPPPPTAPPVQYPSYIPPHRDTHELGVSEFNHATAHLYTQDSTSDYRPARIDPGRQRSNSRVRFALPVDGDESHIEVVEPGSPPPPYSP